MDKEEKLIYLYLNNINSTASFIELVLTQLATFYEGIDKMVEVLNKTNAINKDLLSEIDILREHNAANMKLQELICSYGGINEISFDVLRKQISINKNDSEEELRILLELIQKLANSPESIIKKSLIIKTFNIIVFKAIEAILTIETTKEIVPFFKKVTESNNKINTYVNDLIRTYIVNLPDDMKSMCIEKLKMEEIESIIAVIKEVIESAPEDIEARKLLSELEKKRELNAIFYSSTDSTANQLEEQAKKGQ